jgi:O-antigen/teichoic acid export membrane protein
VSPPAKAPADRLAAGLPDPTDILDTAGAGPLAIRGGLARAAAFGASIAVATAAAAVLTRHLGVVDFGRYATVISVVAVVAGFAEGGLTTVGVREFSSSTGEARDRFMANLTGLRVVVGLLGLAIATGFAWVAGYDRAMVTGTAVAGLGLLLAVLQVTFTVPLQSSLRLVAFSLLDLLRQVGTVTAIVVLVVAGAGLEPFFAAQIFGALLALAVTVPLARGTMPLLPAFERAPWRRLMREALPVTAASAVGILYYRVAQILMSLVSTPTETGYFGASFRVVEVLVAIPGLLVTAAFPILSRSARTDRARLAYALQRMFDVGVLLGALTAIVVAFGADPGIRLIAGASFAPSAEVLRIQGVALAATFLVATWGFALLSLRAHGAIVGANALAFALATGLVLVLAPAHGATGAAVAMTVTEAVLAAVYGVLLMRSRPELRVSLVMVPRVMVASAAAVAAGLVPGLADAMSVVVAVVVYAVVALALRAVPEEVLHAVRRRDGEG